MTFISIIIALIVLLVLITVHEFGHYVAGKIFGFKINEFSIGFGPKLYQKVNKKTGEVFSVRWLPLGGYCAFEGEDEDNPSKDAFNNKAPWRRLIVLVSGVLFNFIFGIITAAIFLMVNGYGQPCISVFSPNNPNAETGKLQKGDIITHINGKSIEVYRSMTDITNKIKAGEDITIRVKRSVNGKTEIVDVEGVEKFTNAYAYFYVANTYAVENAVYHADKTAYSVDEFQDAVMSVVPIMSGDTYKDFRNDGLFYKKNADGTFSLYDAKELSNLAGITLVEPGATSIGIVFYNAHARYGFFESIFKAFPFCFYICGLILSALGGIFTGSTALSELGGTVTAISQIAEITRISFSSFLLMLPMLAMNLALFNILPIPALDGAHCVFVLIEWIFRKPVPRKIENWINNIGLIVLLGLVVFLDVYHFFIL